MPKVAATITAEGKIAVQETIDEKSNFSIEPRNGN